MKNYSVIIGNHERHCFSTQSEAQSKANDYVHFDVKVAYWPDRDAFPTIVGDNRAVRVQHALDNNLL